MLIWLTINVLLPLLPLGLVAALSRVFKWQRGVIEILGDGQLYFFSGAIVWVFCFDAAKANKLDIAWFPIVFFAFSFLLAFYIASVFVAHSGRYDVPLPDGRVESALLSRKLAFASVMLTFVSVGVICYGRDQLGLL